MSDVTRRDFFHSAAAVTAAGALGAAARTAAADSPAERPLKPGASNAPVIISSANGLRATAKAAEMIQSGADTLDAVIAGVNIVEEDPDDISVGYGGLPNEDGVVELDSCVMHGPTCRAGSVAALQNIKTPSKVAKVVMERTDHCMLVGEGALRFARAHGFREADLLTEKSREIWLKWKESHSDDDDWIRPEVYDTEQHGAADPAIPYHYGTINCCACNAAGEVSGVTTTSGLSYKIPGRVGDSPIIGAGLYVDRRVGAAGSTGRGEAVIKTCGSHTVVEAMRHGMAPLEACLYALKRVVETTTEPHLRLPDGRPNFDVKYYAISIEGRYGAASLWSGAKFSINEGGRNRHEDCAYLFKRPMPKHR